MFGLWLVLSLLTQPALAANRPDSSLAVNEWIHSLEDPAVHCGGEPDMDLYEGLVQSLSESNKTANQYTDQYLDQLKLRLVMHFQPNSVAIPKDCQRKLEAISDRAKEKKIGTLFIRSITRTGSSSEIDLARASARLAAIKDFLRGDRLARRVMILELSPMTISPILTDSLKAARLVEIYSSPLD